MTPFSRLRSSASRSRRGFGPALGLCMILGLSGAMAASPQQGSAPGLRSSSPPENDATSRNAAARSRMLECGHQWSAMKRAGTATGTWKDFSRGCLAQR